MTDDIREIMRDLADPFPEDAIGWKPGAVSGSRALALAYIDARDVQDRLDQVLGAVNWRTEYHVQPDHNVVCVLSLRIGGEWISKSDVGGPSDQKDPGDRMKATFSDSFKRAAVVWGIGRYLYRLENAWCDYDAQKKQIVRPPPLPAWAAPRRIKPEQAEEIRKLLVEVDGNESLYLDAVIAGQFGGRPTRVEDIPARLHTRALELVKQKKARMALEAARKATAKPAAQTANAAT